MLDGFFDKDRLNGFPIVTQENCPSLFQAVKEEKLIVFIGAGVSRLTGCKGWDELGIALTQKCRENELFTHAEEEHLKKEAIYNPRKVISICFQRCKMKENLNAYYDSIRESIRINKPEELKIYRQINELKAKSYITTNIDRGIKQFNPDATRQQIYDCTGLGFRRDLNRKRNILRDGNVFYLHGTEDNMNDTIFSVDKYLEFYQRSYILKFLKEKVFSDDNVILFIGYGLSEWEILEHIFRTTKHNQSKFHEYYVLSPIFSSEITKHHLDSTYFKDYFGISTLPYFLDHEGYKQLFVVLEKLGKAFRDCRPTTDQKFNQISQVLNVPPEIDR